jgi:hypothetical protein
MGCRPPGRCFNLTYFSFATLTQDAWVKQTSWSMRDEIAIPILCGGKAACKAKTQSVESRSLRHPVAPRGPLGHCLGQSGPMGSPWRRPHVSRGRAARRSDAVHRPPNALFVTRLGNAHREPAALPDSPCQTHIRSRSWHQPKASLRRFTKSLAESRRHHCTHHVADRSGGIIED